MSLSTPTRPFGRKQPPTSLPDSKSTFEPLLKRELANRLVVICAISFAFTFLVSLITTLNFQKGPPLGIFGHVVALTLMAFCSLAIGAGPPLVLRGHDVSARYTPLPTRYDTFVALLSSPRTWRTFTYFSFSGFSLTLLHVAFLNMSEWEDSRLSVLAPTRRNTFRLNERFFYLAFFNASLGLIFASRDLIRHRWTTRWPRTTDERDAVTVHAPSSRVLEAVLSALNHKALVSTALIATIHTFLFPVSYHLSRALALPLLRNMPGLSWLTRPLLHGFGRTWAVDVSWSRMLALGFKTCLGWELVETAFDYWSTKPITASPKAKDPNVALVTGLHSQDRYFKYHAYLELSALASSRAPAASTRRTALFIDTKTSPTLWSALVREVLVVLGRDYQLLLRRGKPAPPAPAPAPVPAPTARMPRTPSTPLLRQQILKASPRSLFDTLGSDGAATKALTTVASLPENISVPSVFLPSTPPTARTEKKEVVKAPAAKPTPRLQIGQRLRAGKSALVVGVLGWMEGKFPSEWKVREWWVDVSLERQARACLPDVELDVAGIEALSHLIAASLSEDSLGAVQRDIPRVLEAMLSFLAEAEAYQAEIEAKLAPTVDPASGAHTSQIEALKAAKEVARAVEVVSPIIFALRSGVGLIAKTFGDRLGVYKFPPTTAKRLQSFMDYL